MNTSKFVFQNNQMKFNIRAENGGYCQLLNKWIGTINLHINVVIDVSINFCEIRS